MATTVEEVVKFLRETDHVCTEVEIAEAFSVHPGTARRKLEGALYHKLVIVDDHDEEGRKLTKSNWRYAAAEP